MINDIELKTIEKRLDGIKEGIQRLRTILIITTVASSAIFFVLFNSNLSRVHSMALAERNNKVQSEGRTFAELGKEVLLSDWYRSRNIQVNFLGVSVNVTDLPIVGSLTFTVITIWYFYSYRQTNRAIVGILEEVKEKEKDQVITKEEIISLRKMIYTSISQTSVFTKNDTLHAAGEKKSESFSKRTTLVKAGVESQNKRPKWLRRMFQWIKGIAGGVMNWLDRKLLGESDRPIEYGKKTKNVEKEPATFTDRLVIFMFYLPFWTTFSVLVRETYNLLSTSPIKNSSAIEEIEIYNMMGLSPLQDSLVFDDLSPLEEFLASRQIVSMYIEQHYWDIALAIFFFAFALLFVIYLLVLCNGCLEFSRASTKSLWEFNKETAEMEGRDRTQRNDAALP